VLREPSIAALGALLGLALVGGVVAWKLARSSYPSDVQTVCNAESRSGLALRHEMPALTSWMRGHVTTADGQELLADLGDLPMTERAGHLRGVATAAGVGDCPMAVAYETLVAEGHARADWQRLCSYVTFPGLAQRDDAARLDALETWIAGEASDPGTRALAGPLHDAASASERARVLRLASRSAGIFTCDIAKVLELPPPPPDAGTDAETSRGD
jgi:hypothetical protein